MSDRDDLARELFIADNSAQSREASIEDWEALRKASGQYLAYTYELAETALAWMSKRYGKDLQKLQESTLEEKD